MLPKRLSLVTLGVSDVSRARKFYERLGFEPAGVEDDSIAFFQLEGSVLALFGREALAEDAGVSDAGGGFRGVSLAINLGSETEVDEALRHAKSCGASIVKPARRMPWGGYSGYFADLDGHLWEVAHNPVFPLDESGRMQLPPPKKAE